MYQVDFKKEIGLVYFCFVRLCFLKQPNPQVATGWVFLIEAQVDKFLFLEREDDGLEVESRPEMVQATD